MLVAAKGLGDSEALADIIFSRAIGLVIFVAFLADNQQWCTFGAFDEPFHFHADLSMIDFYEAREEYRKTAKVPKGYYQEDLDRGFKVTGLFAWSRHPNFTAEQSVWVMLYAWGAYITRGYFNWSIAGALSYLLLFQGSTWLTELISTRKYPEYAEYQRRVGRFLPRLPGGPPGDFSDKRKTE